jgi:hypothetical protein
MPILELSEAQVVDLVRQLPPDQQRRALLALAAGAAQRRDDGCSSPRRHCAASPPSVAWIGTSCRKATARGSWMIWCMRTGGAEGSRLRHEYPVLAKNCTCENGSRQYKGGRPFPENAIDERYTA